MMTGDYTPTIVNITFKVDGLKIQIEKELKLEKADQTTLLPKVAKMMKDAKIDIKDKDLKTALDEFLAAADTEAPAEDAEAKTDATEDEK